MGDVSERIIAAKKSVEQLQQKLATPTAEKRDGFPGMQTLASGRITKTFNQPRVRRMLRGHFGKVYSMQWAGNSIDLVSASQDGKLIVWNAKENIKLQAIPLRSAWVMTCSFEQTRGNFVACGGLDNVCSVFQLGNDGPVTRSHRELAGHDGYLSSCKFINEGSILTSSGDQTCMLWDVELGQVKTSFTGHDGDVMSVSVLPSVDPNIFVSGSCDATAKVWDIRMKMSTMTLRGHESDVNCVCLFPDGKAFGTGSDDASCRIFDMRAVSEVSAFQNEMVVCGITSVAFSSSGRLLFAGYDDYNCTAWDILGSTSKGQFVLSGHENRVSCVGVTPNGDALCTGSWDTSLRVWA